MSFRSTATLLFLAVAAGALAAKAEESLPAGLVRSGGVIMMQPIGDSDVPSGASASEHHPGTLRALSSADHAIYLRAFEAAERGDWAQARTLADQGHDADAHKLLDWMRLLDKNSGAPFAEIDAFLKSNPDWPSRETLFARAEATIDPAMSAPAIVAWFSERTPASSFGRIKLGEALIPTG